MKHIVLFLIGPTGSGKTELSLLLAERLGCEIISADSMLVYRDMNIGTAKPAPSLRKKSKHHLIDFVSPRKNFSVYEHRENALQAIRDIQERGKIPLVVGGSGLYVSALWKGLSPHPGGSVSYRNRILKQGEKKIAFLYQKLASLDPARAEKIHPNDFRRIIRALEIIERSGKIPSDWYQRKESLADLGYNPKVFGVLRDRAELYERINERVEQMFRSGWIREVKRLKKAGFSRTAKSALGYRDILHYLKEKENPYRRAELIHLIQKRTRQFAKRQLTWFRREKEIQWIPWQKGESVSGVCDKIVMELKP